MTVQKIRLITNSTFFCSILRTSEIDPYVLFGSIYLDSHDFHGRKADVITSISVSYIFSVRGGLLNTLNMLKILYHFLKTKSIMLLSIFGIRKNLYFLKSTVLPPIKILKKEEENLAA